MEPQIFIILKVHLGSVFIDEIQRTIENISNRLKSVFLISLTGYARQEDLKHAKEAGFRYQLAKPVVLDDLRRALSQVV